MKRAGVNRGDIVYFDQDEDGTLKLITSTDLEQEKTLDVIDINVDLCKNPHMLSRILVGNYILGRDIIRVNSDMRVTSDFLDAIRNTIKELMGLAIIESTPNQVVIQSSIDITKFPIHTLLRRIYIIASTMYNEAIEAFFKAETTLAKDAVNRKNEVDTMFWVIVRLLDSAQRDRETSMKIDIEDPIQIIWYRVVAQCLWLIGSWSEKIANRVLAMDPQRQAIGEPVLKEVEQLSENAANITQKAMNSLFSNSIELANDVIDEYHALQLMEEILQQELLAHACSARARSSENLASCMGSHLSFFVWAMRRIAELGSEIAELAITKALSKETKICYHAPDVQM